MWDVRRQRGRKNELFALFPIGLFLVSFLGTGILTKDFYRMPAISAFSIALLAAFLQRREISFSEKMKVVSEGIGNETIVTMCFIFLMAGAFSGLVTAIGSVESTVQLGLAILPPQMAVVGLLWIAAFISVSMGTSMGTIAALAPIAVGISEKTGSALAFCMGAVVCGAMFGDNLSMISDTTIAAVRTQGCGMKDKFKQNLFFVLPAIVITIFLFWNQSKGLAAKLAYGDNDIIKVLPYVAVFFSAFFISNVFLVLMIGIGSAILIGLLCGGLSLSKVFVVLGDGMASMYDITMISIVVAAVVALVKHYGGIAYLLKWIQKRIHKRSHAMYGIACLAVLLDLTTANNTISIIIAGPIARKIGEEYDISPRETASILDIFTAAVQGMLPYGAQLLLAAQLSGLTPFAILPYVYYPVIMCISTLCFLAFPRKRNIRTE